MVSGLGLSLRNLIQNRYVKNTAIAGATLAAGAGMASLGLMKRGAAEAQAQFAPRGSQQRDPSEQGVNPALNRRFNTLTQSLSKQGKSVGTGHKRILIPKGVLSESDLGELGFQSVLAAIPEAGQTRFSSFRHPERPYHVHEHGQFWTMHRDAHVASTMALAKLRASGTVTDNWDVIKETAKGLPHVVTEGIPGLYYYTKGRIEGTEGMSTRLIRELSPSFKAKMNRMSTSNTIPGFDDEYNTIPGLRHGGVAQRMRRYLTAFGSGYDRAREIAKALNMTYEQLLGSTMFKHAIKNAKIQKQFGKQGILGEGVAGIASSMKTTIGGHELEFVQKTLRPFEETVQMLHKNTIAKNPNITMSEVEAHARKMRDLFQEGRALSALRNTKTVPTPYAISENTLAMEMMPGSPLADLKRAGKEIPSSVIAEMQETARAASAEGLVNVDIHGRNIMYAPATSTQPARTSWIDWGAVDQLSKPQNKMQQAFMARQMAERVEVMQSYYSVKMPAANRVSVATGAETPRAKRLAKEMSATPALSMPKMEGQSIASIAQADTMAANIAHIDTVAANIAHADTMAAREFMHKTAAKEALYSSSLDLREAQKKIWHCGIRGGRYHNRKSRRFVKQLSNSGGGV